MGDQSSDALVFFGATGDLAYKKIFPSLQALQKRGHLDVPIVGVAKSGWTLDQLKNRMKEAFKPMVGLIRRHSTSCAACCVMSMATTVIRPLSRRCAGSLERRDGRRITSLSRRCFLDWS
jgi:glucose-6-phosphate dehydrogenase-like protein